MRKALTGSVLLLTLFGSAAIAQSSGVPREFPPADFTGNQFVDSEGCAFIRAGISGNTNWVPRVDRQRRQLCNFEPTFAAVAEAPAEADLELLANAAEALEGEDVALTQAAEDLPLIIFPTDDQRANTPAPPRTVTLPAAPAAPAPAAVTAQQIVPPVVTVPEPEPEVAPQLTKAEFCDGKFGPQPGFVSSSTGDVIDCGPDPAAVAAATPEPVAPIATIAAVPEPVAAPEPPKMTLAQVCEAMDTENRRFVDASTGEPISCPKPETTLAAVSAPVARPAPQIAAPVETSSACPEIPAPAGVSVRCGPQSERPWTTTRDGDRTTRSRTRFIGLNGAPVPASNPVNAAAVATPRPPAGYQPTFTDGRHNTKRGIPSGASAAPVAAQAAAVSTGPYRYIQVGSFGVHSNADALMARLGGMGLSTASGSAGTLKIVAVGPFASTAEMQRALGTVRSMGFTDAFARN